eukprot:Cvel_10546.t3-p1 / transcript=Cvel_10546.t3 / gene=Cvel_10546 / organism=Chromera_velia_CCMP2878 / gene_product=hypothetical protein / transcript_product=hypothetical protein / location=Cvel_scaffold638:63191-64872(+) / protein_length=343 / sequence_SO=supercontig / SO=protein_coding / is_pseudo=false
MAGLHFEAVDCLLEKGKASAVFSTNTPANARARGSCGSFSVLHALAVGVFLVRPSQQEQDEARHHGTSVGPPVESPIPRPYPLHRRVEKAARIMERFDDTVDPREYSSLRDSRGRGAGTLLRLFFRRFNAALANSKAAAATRYTETIPPSGSARIIEADRAKVPDTAAVAQRQALFDALVSGTNPALAGVTSHSSPLGDGLPEVWGWNDSFEDTQRPSSAERRRRIPKKPPAQEPVNVDTGGPPELSRGTYETGADILKTSAVSEERIPGKRQKLRLGDETDAEARKRTEKGTGALREEGRWHLLFSQASSLATALDEGVPSDGPYSRLKLNRRPLYFKQPEA